MTPLVSPKTREAFADYFAGVELKDIRAVFNGAGVACASDWTPPGSQGQRRTLIHQYYRTVDWSDPSSVSAVLAVFASEIQDLQAPAGTYGTFDDATNALSRGHSARRLLYWLDRDGYEMRRDRLVRLTDFHAAATLEATSALLEGPNLQDQIMRIRDSIESDPALAIGSAKELIEAVCHTILTQLGQPIVGTPDIPTLTKATMKALRLVSDDVSDAAKGADSIRRILQNLGSMGQHLAELRNLYGTGHGKGAARKGLAARHARLAVNASSAVALFLAETYADQDRAPSQSGTHDGRDGATIEAPASKNG